MGNYRDREVFIYGMDEDQPVLIGKITSADVDKDYGRYYHPDEDGADLWPEADIKVNRNFVIIERAAFGAHAAPTFTAVLKYYWDGSHFTLMGKPTLRKNKRTEDDSPP